MSMTDFPPRGTRVVAIAGGMGHTVVVLSSGEVYGWGTARKGQLGERWKSSKIVWEPVKVEIDVEGFFATGVVCGREFTVVIGDKEKGEMVVLGGGDKWGILAGVSAATAPRLRFRGLGASWHGVYVHRGDGEVVAWGRNDRGQLPPRGMGVVRRLAVGSEHVLALLGDGRTVLAFGWGEHGNCGPVTDAQGNVNGECVAIPLPEGVQEVVGIGAGCATSWVITRG
ncbi:RCC1/BLIP-II [Aspergillus ellipticus CBS 707.79]|uniref:RCC1/BLIP-II n=1 Tax=Aspergillus ellipticus CBS 707.79 TaxID=1448320 RepID=A0A319E9Y6_9EURO|nr:RCC1/BLIP-II [Aspergillus ellipticus CBS 707.79]